MPHAMYTLSLYFKQKGFIQGALAAQIARYVAIWQNAMPVIGDKFKLHPLLPLQILDTVDGFGKPCDGCGRILMAAAFSKRSRAQKPQCWVCRAISVRNHRGWPEREDEAYGSD